MGKKLGYVRVSDKGQNEARQIEALKEYVAEKKIYMDKKSGKDFEREGFQALIKELDQGDTLYIKSIDRLGRNKEQIKGWLQYFKDEGIRLKVIDVPTTMEDYGEKQAWVMEMVNNILIEVYTSIAEAERMTIRQRQAEGIAIAKAAGKYTGRKKKHVVDSRFIEVHRQWKNGDITAVKASEILNIPRGTMYRLAKELEVE